MSSAIKYETHRDRAREREVLIKIAAEFPKHQLHITPDFYACDGLLSIFRQPRIQVEVKCRNNTHDAYPTIVLSLTKYNALVSLRIPAMLAVQWTDRCGYLWLTEPDEIIVGGRPSRGAEILGSWSIAQVIFI